MRSSGWDVQNSAKGHSWHKHFIVPDVQNSAKTHSWPKHFIVPDVQNSAKCHSEAMVQTAKRLHAVSNFALLSLADEDWSVQTRDTTDVCSRFGQHYWLVDIDMDCSRTDNGYFELKAIVGGWEGNVVQGSCTGSRGGAAAYSSSNHIARCGFLNIYHFGTSICTIEPIP